MVCPHLLTFCHSHGCFIICHKHRLFFTFINVLPCLFLMWGFWKIQKLCSHCCHHISRIQNNISYMFLRGNLKLLRVSVLLVPVDRSNLILMATLLSYHHSSLNEETEVLPKEAMCPVIKPVSERPVSLFWSYLTLKKNALSLCNTASDDKTEVLNLYHIPCQ